jgi:Replication protein
LCSLWLGFAWAPERQDAGVLTLKLREARFCRVRHCPICQWRRSLMWLARFQTALPQLLVQHPTARFLFLTLTQKNVSIGELRLTLRDMTKAWETTFHAYLWTKETGMKDIGTLKGDFASAALGINRPLLSEVMMTPTAVAESAHRNCAASPVRTLGGSGKRA